MCQMNVTGLASAATTSALPRSSHQAQGWWFTPGLGGIGTWAFKGSPHKNLFNCPPGTCTIIKLHAVHPVCDVWCSHSNGSILTKGTLSAKVKQEQGIFSLKHVTSKVLLRSMKGSAFLLGFVICLLFSTDATLREKYDIFLRHPLVLAWSLKIKSL